MDDFRRFLLKQFRINLTERDKDPSVTFSRLKYFYDYSDICYIVDNLNNHTYEKLIYGCSTPTSISELGDTETLYLDKKDELIKEINWALLSIRKYETEINSFIKLRDKYENALLTGDYENSLLYLNKIESDICISLWSIEQRFILIEIQKGLKENTAFLTKINKDNKKWFIKYFSHFFSLKSEKELSVNQYKLSLARLLFKYYEDQNHIDLDYYNFKLNFLEVDSFSYLPTFLTFEGYHSIIDRYITLIRILQLEVLKLKDNKYPHQLDSRVYYLSKKIQDHQINKLRFAIDTKFEWDYTLSNIDSESISALDIYTSGDFPKAESMFLKLILKYPKNIELYELYVKSLLLQGKKFTSVGTHPSSFQNRILKSLFNLFEKKQDGLEAVNELQTVAYNLSSINSVSYALINYYHYEVSGVKKMSHLERINSNFYNPKLLSEYSSNSTYEKIVQKLGPSISLDLLNLKKQFNSEGIKSHQSLSPFRKQILEGNFHQKNGEYGKAISIWEKILQEQNLKDFQKESILTNLFVCKEHLKFYNECINLYVAQYFKNPVLVKNIHVEEIKKNIKRSKFKAITHTINLPIFYRLTDSEDYETHTAYECFLQHNGFFTPKDLISANLNIDQERLSFFLENICTLDIFKHSPFITSTKQKLDERISICQFLLDQNPPENKEKDYINEIERLTKKQIIQKGIQEIDESKIYVNQNGIIESELKNITPIYNRFKAIGELNSETDISIINLYSDKVFSFKNSNQSEGNEISKDPQFDVFKDIFHYVLDKFLFGHYGLQQYLSARIRHGVLLGEIRPEFELLNLITEIEKGIDKYKSNEFWNPVLRYENKNQYDRVQTMFAHFSRKIDTLINEEILSKYLQIKFENKNPDGWLDYTFEEFILQIHYIPLKDSKDINAFLSSIFNVLWQRTEKNLETIRDNINEKIRDEFFKIILELEKNLVAELGTIPEVLYNNITESRVNIENKLNKIANWFNITDSNISDFKMDKIIDVSIEYSQQSNVNKAIELQLCIQADDLIKGTFYPAFVDLFRIFLDNSLKHAGFDENEEVPISILVTNTNGLLSIEIKNQLSESIDVSDLKAKIDSFTMDLNKSMMEGRSGFHKAMRIIKSDFNNDKNDMKLFIDEENNFCVNISIFSNELLK